MQILSQLFERKTITEIALPRFFVPFPAFVFIDVLYRFTLSLIFFGCLSQNELIVSGQTCWKGCYVWCALSSWILVQSNSTTTNPLMKFSSVNPVDWMISSWFPCTDSIISGSDLNNVNKLPARDAPSNTSHKDNGETIVASERSFRSVKVKLKK